MPIDEELDAPWDLWVMMAGRGSGKTRSGAEAVKEAEAMGYSSFCLIGETKDSVQDLMIEGPSGILSLYRHLPRDQRPTYNRSDKKISWPSGAIAKAFTSYKPDGPRGFECDFIWADELSSWMYARDTFDNATFSHRTMDPMNPLRPRIYVSTTPKPVPLMKDIINGKEGNTVITFGSTKANLKNLPQSFIDKVYKRYEGTRTGRQELHGELLLDMPGGLWRHEDIQELTLTEFEATRRHELDRVVVTLDPAVTVGEDADESGLYVVGATKGGSEGFVLENASLKGSPNTCARRAVGLFDKYDAETIVIETNNGGDYLPEVFNQIRPGIPVTQVKGTRGTGGKSRRAQPVAALYEQKRIWHVGSFPILNSQMLLMTVTGWEGEGSPDHLDAVVWGFTHLFPEFVDAGRTSTEENRAKKKRRSRHTGRIT